MVSRPCPSHDLQPYLRGKQLKGEIHCGGLTIHDFQLGVQGRGREQTMVSRAASVCLCPTNGSGFPSMVPAEGYAQRVGGRWELASCCCAPSPLCMPFSPPLET